MVKGKKISGDRNCASTTPTREAGARATMAAAAKRAAAASQRGEGRVIGGSLT
jgi:hypothetical protein